MWIKQYILTITSVVVFSAMAEALMPENTMKKHISLVAGLLVLLAISKPIINMTKLKPIDLNLNFDIESESGDILNKLERTQSNEIENTFEASLSSSIEKELSDKFGVSLKVNVVKSKDNTVEIKLYGAENEQLRKHIKYVYGLESTFEKGGV